MDVTPQLLKEVEFREKFRGYDPDEVDDFLERVGVTLNSLNERVREANDQVESANARAARAEARARDSSDIDDTLRRTLVLAQRTADAAVAEAKEQAASIVADAGAQAQAKLSGVNERAAAVTATAEDAARRKAGEAESQSAQLLAGARATSEQTVASAREQANRLLMEARRESEQITASARASADADTENRRKELAADVEKLGAQRTSLEADAQLLSAYVARNRARIDAAATQLRALHDDPAGLVADPLPVLKDAPAFSASEASREAPSTAPSRPLHADRNTDDGPGRKPVLAIGADANATRLNATESRSADSPTASKEASSAAETATPRSEPLAPSSDRSPAVVLRSPTVAPVRAGSDAGSPVAERPTPVPVVPDRSGEIVISGPGVLVARTDQPDSRTKITETVASGSAAISEGSTDLAESAASSDAGAATAGQDLAAQPLEDPDATQRFDVLGLDVSPHRATMPGAGTWPAGGPPPPPPPPRFPRAGREIPDASAPPPPPPAPSRATDSERADAAEADAGLKSPVPAAPIAPWLSTRSEARPAPPPPPVAAVPLSVIGAPPARDSFLEELRRAVGDDDDAAPATTKDADAYRGVQDHSPPSLPAAEPGEDDEDTPRSWFGRRR